MERGDKMNHRMSEITYTQVGDYLLPNIILSDPPSAKPLNKYGRMRQTYLKDHKPILYNQLLLTEKLYPHLRDTGHTAMERLDTLVKQLIKSDPPPDKASDQMGWVSHMNALHHSAEEIIISELVYE